VSSVSARKSRYVQPPAPQPVARRGITPGVFVWPAVPLVVGGLAVIALVAVLKSPAPAATSPVALEPAPQAMTFVTQSVNVANKGAKLEMVARETAPVVAAPAAAPKKIRVASITPDVALGNEPELQSPAVKGKPSYGLASYYWQGSKTASGEKFNADELTAAHRTLPFGTRVRVTSLATGRSVTVRINDRGPFIAGRTVDISRAAAQSLGMIDRGVTKVKLDVLQ
jgi:rare lipoprotein A